MIMATSLQPGCPSGGLNSRMGLTGTSVLMEWGGQGSSVDLSFGEAGQERVLLTGPLSPNFQSALLYGGSWKEIAEGTHRVTHTLPCHRGREQQGLWVKQRQLALLQYTSDSVPWCPECATQEPASTVQLRKCPAPPGPEPIAQALRIQRGAKARKNLSL